MRTLILSFALALTFAGQSWSAPLASVAAVVNGDMITVRELERATAPEIMFRKLDPEKPGDAAQIRDIMRENLDSMINEKILMQEAARLGIVVSEAMIDAQIDQVVAESQLSRDQFMLQLTETGLSMDNLRARVKAGLVSQQLIGRMVINKVVVTQDEINAYYRQNQGQMPSGKVRLGLIIYPASENAEDWAARIASGATTFGDVARAVSVGPNAAGGGDMGYLDMEDLASVLRGVAENLKKGEVSRPFELQINMGQIQLIDVVDAASESGGNATANQPDAATAARIEEILRTPRLEARFTEYTAQLRNKALIDIRF